MTAYVKKLFSLMFMALALTIMVLPQPAQAFEEKPVGFVVIDHDGGVNGKVYKDWRSVVKWAYHFPYYQITDDGTPQQVVAETLRDGVKVTKETMSALAEKSQVEVLVVARIYEMDETIVHSMRFYDDDTLVRVVASADLYVYKKDGDKFLKKKLREGALKDLGNYEKPVETIKWALSKLVNTMENRPIIGE